MRLSSGERTARAADVELLGWRQDAGRRQLPVGLRCTGVGPTPGLVQTTAVRRRVFRRAATLARQTLAHHREADAMHPALAGRSGICVQFMHHLGLPARTCA